jgi:hypothetical protein
VWAGSQVTLKQTEASLTVESGAGTAAATMLIYHLDGTDGPSAPQAAWRGSQLVLTSTSSMSTAAGPVVMQNTTAVLSLESPSTMTVQIVRRGVANENTTVTYVKRPLPPRR